MPLPQSGISRYETFMNKYLPSGIHVSEEEHGVYHTDQNVDEVELKYYWGQIQLRITLNSAHASLYDGADVPSKSALIHLAVLLASGSASTADRLQRCNSLFKRLY
jgi:hypothetical protein